MRVSLLALGVVALTTCGWQIGRGGEVDLTAYDRRCGVDVTERDDSLTITWPGAAGVTCRLVLDLLAQRPLLRSLSVAPPASDVFEAILEDQEPFVLLRVGQRDLNKRDGWTIFFDNTPSRPSQLYCSELNNRAVHVSSQHRRATIRCGPLTLGPFQGEWNLTLYSGESLVHLRAAVSSGADGQAILYDAGLISHGALPQQVAWMDAQRGKLATAAPNHTSQRRNVAAHFRTVLAQSEGGSVALFPPPHRYFYPLDSSDNLRNLWFGRVDGEADPRFGFGIRHEQEGDRRWVPWFNAPPGSRQQLEFFLRLSPVQAEQALGEVKRFTHGDSFVDLSEHLKLTSHYHVEHTLDLLRRQGQQQTSTAPLRLRLASGRGYSVPPDLVEPGFVKVFKQMGIDIVHLAEFHTGRTPRLAAEERLPMLELLHAECRRLSDPQFLLLPGEEPNVHLGGHWISFFPKPVYWVLNRGQETPFVQSHDVYGRVYHVGGPEDVLRLLEEESGLAWTAHPRIKGSTGFPDGYRFEDFYQSDRFLGAAWKAMPADLSQPRLGWRVLDLLDDMANWGQEKYVLGEVDVFKIQPDHELYGHMNVNYLRLHKLPRFDDGWSEVLAALRAGAFFTTTGEVLISSFHVGGKQSGERSAMKAESPPLLEAQLEWTFPLAYAQVVSGDGASVYVERIDLSDTLPFAERTLRLRPQLAGRKWVRLEVWDVATNGAFTQPVWLDEP